MTATADTTAAWTAESRRSRLGGPVPWLLAAIAVVLSFATVAAIDELQRYRDEQRVLIAPGAAIAGVDVSGMDRARAIEAVEAAISRRMDHLVELRAGERKWAATWRTLGATADVASAVDRALAASDDLSWWELVRLRYGSYEVPFSAEVPIDEPHVRAREWLEEIAAELYVAPVDAQIHWDQSRYWVTPAVTGQAVSVTSTLAALREAFREYEGGVELFIDELHPLVGDDRFRQVLFLDQRAHRLDFYEDGQVRASYTVAVGTSGYPTPTGQHEVTLKRYRPTWINPDPTGWGRSMPRRIGPGPNNPLGLRALNWSVPNIRFHGTANVNSLGRDASHGCVRLSNEHIIQLYDMVDTGAIIISVA